MRDKKPRRSSGFCGTSSRGRGQIVRGHQGRPSQCTQHGTRSVVSLSSFSSLIPSTFNFLPASSYHTLLVQRFSSVYLGPQGQYQSRQPYLSWDYFDCGELGYLRKYCPRLIRGVAHQGSQLVVSMPVASPIAQTARGGGHAVRGRQRGGGLVGGS